MVESRFNLAQVLVPQQTELSALEVMEGVGFASSHLGLRLLQEHMDAKPGAVVRPPLQKVRDIAIVAETLGFGLGAGFASRPGSHLQLAAKMALLTGLSPTIDIMYTAGQYYFNQAGAGTRNRNQRGRTAGRNGSGSGRGPVVEVITSPTGGDSGAYAGNYAGNGTSGERTYY